IVLCSWLLVQSNRSVRVNLGIQATERLKGFHFLIADERADLEEAQLPFDKTEFNIPRERLALGGSGRRILSFDLGHHLSELPDFIRGKDGVLTAHRKVDKTSVRAKRLAVGSARLLQQADRAVRLQK